MNYSQFLSNLLNSDLQNILGWLLPCAIFNTKQNFAAWQQAVLFISVHELEPKKMGIWLQRVDKT